MTSPLPPPPAPGEDIITQLHTCLDQLSIQFYASIRYISEHHPSTEHFGAPHLFDEARLALSSRNQPQTQTQSSSQNQSFQTQQPPPPSSFSSQPPTQQSPPQSQSQQPPSTLPTSQSQPQSQALPPPSSLDTLPPSQQPSSQQPPPPTDPPKQKEEKETEKDKDPPEPKDKIPLSPTWQPHSAASLALDINELAGDLILKQRQIEALLTKLPRDLGAAEKEQDVKIQGLMGELRGLEGRVREAGKVKDGLRGRVEGVIGGVGRGRGNRV